MTEATLLRIPSTTVRIDTFKPAFLSRPFADYLHVISTVGGFEVTKSSAVITSEVVALVLSSSRSDLPVRGLWPYHATFSGRKTAMFSFLRNQHQ
jgi:hypothetical protein